MHCVCNGCIVKNKKRKKSKHRTRNGISALLTILLNLLNVKSSGLPDRQGKKLSTNGGLHLFGFEPNHRTVQVAAHHSPSPVLGTSLQHLPTTFEEIHLLLARHGLQRRWNSTKVSVQDLIDIGALATLDAVPAHDASILDGSRLIALDARHRAAFLPFNFRSRWHRLRSSFSHE